MWQLTNRQHGTRSFWLSDLIQLPDPGGRQAMAPCHPPMGSQWSFWLLALSWSDSCCCSVGSEIVSETSPCLSLSLLLVLFSMKKRKNGLGEAVQVTVADKGRARI